jgi:TRAP-type mannitol/chloroaromatic compound transport system permease small subunit
MSGLGRFVSGIDTLSKWTGTVVGYFVPIMMLVLIYEVVMRYVFNEPTNWAHETSLYLFGSYFMLLGGYALYSRAHIAMDLLYNRWAPRMQAIADLITSLLFFFLIGGLLYFGAEYAWESVMRWEHSRTAWNPPIYPFKLMIPLGLTLILLQGLAKFVRDLNMAITGKKLQ